MGHAGAIVNSGAETVDKRGTGTAGVEVSDTITRIGDAMKGFKDINMITNAISLQEKITLISNITSYLTGLGAEFSGVTLQR